MDNAFCVISRVSFVRFFGGFAGCKTATSGLLQPIIRKWSHNGKIWRVSINGGYPQIIHFDGTFPYKPSIVRYPNLGKRPYDMLGKRWERRIVLCRVCILALDVNDVCTCIFCLGGCQAFDEGGEVSSSVIKVQPDKSSNLGSWFLTRAINHSQRWTTSYPMVYRFFPRR